MREPPKILNARVVMRPCTSMALEEAGRKVALKTVDEFLEERYPGWKTEMMVWMQDQIGLDVLLALPPVEYAKLGFVFCLIKERKI